MSRPSLEALRFPRLDSRTARLSPPRGLEKQTAEVLRKIVGACDARHFTDSDAPLLVDTAERCCRRNERTRNCVPADQS